jgi:hypothetical protein
MRNVPLLGAWGLNPMTALFVMKKLSIETLKHGDA